MTKLNPIHDRVLVRSDKDPEVVGGIAIPIEFRRPNNQGTVVAVGPGRITGAGELEPVAVQPGDRVVYVQAPKGYEHESCEVDGEQLLVMRDRDVLAVLED